MVNMNDSSDKELIFSLTPEQTFNNTTIEFNAKKGYLLRFNACINGTLELNARSTNNLLHYVDDKINESYTSNRFINHYDLVSKTVNLLTSIDVGYGIDKNSISIIQDSNYNLSNYFEVSSGIYSVKYDGFTQIGNNCNIIFFNENKEAVCVYNDEKWTGVDGNQYTTHGMVEKHFVIKKDFILNNAIKYARVAIPSSYGTYLPKLNIYKLTSKSFVNESKLNKFNYLSNNGSFVRMSWFKDYDSTVQKIKDMASLVNVGGVLYFDDGNLELDSSISLDVDGIGKSLSIIIDEGTVIKPSNSFTDSYLMNYIQTKQTSNVTMYDYDGNPILINPKIEGGIFECEGKCNGINLAHTRGLTVSNICINNANIYGLYCDKKNSREYELTVHHMRFVYDYMEYCDNTAIRTQIGDSHFTEIIIIGYHNAVFDATSSNRWHRIHGWIGFNCENQFANSVFMYSNSVMIECFADTYDKGFIASVYPATLIACRTHVNNAFATTSPINEIGDQVLLVANRFLNN